MIVAKYAKIVLVPIVAYMCNYKTAKHKVHIAVLMIRVEICPDITLSTKNTLTFPLIMYSKCVRLKFILTGKVPKLTGKCLVTGCYYKHCIGLKRILVDYKYQEPISTTKRLFCGIYKLLVLNSLI